MITISLCMIVKNESEILANCLSSIHGITDEIIIVDTGSTDETKKIASQFTDKVFDFEWIEDFAAARNHAFHHATMDYILWLDADDILLKTDQQKLKTLKNTLDTSIDAVSMIYNIAFDEYGNPTFRYNRNRLVKRKRHFKWIGAVHEYLAVSGNIISSDIAVTHCKSSKTTQPLQSDRNLKIYEKRLEKGETFTPRDLFYYANELKDHAQFQKATFYYHEFLATKKGWIEDEIHACINMADCYKNLGNVEKEKESLVMSFLYDIPRPEVSCRLGDYYKLKKEFKKAIIWYRLAIEIEIPENGGFRQETYSTWYPHLQLCVCYWEIDNPTLSMEHNNKAKAYRPNDPTVKINEDFFKNHFKNNASADIKQCLYIGWLGKNNLGDELMFDLFKQQFLSMDKNYILDTVNNEARYLENISLNSYDLIVLGGGSIIEPVTINKLHTALSLNKNILIWGAGMDRLPKSLIENRNNDIKSHFDTTKDYLLKIKEVFEKSVWVGVRGPLTLEILKNIGIDLNKVCVSGDPGLLLRKNQAKSVIKKQNSAIYRTKEKIVGVNWGTAYNSIYGKNEIKVEEQLVCTLQALIQKDYKIYLFIVWPEDLEAIKRLYDKINNAKNVILDHTLHHQDDLIAIIRNFTFTINFKLHANLISLAAHVPFIALGYRFKVYDFIKSINFDTFVIPTDSDHILEQILNLELLIAKNRSDIIKNIKSHQEHYTKIITTPFQNKLFI